MENVSGEWQKFFLRFSKLLQFHKVAKTSELIITRSNILENKTFELRLKCVLIHTNCVVIFSHLWWLCGYAARQQWVQIPLQSFLLRLITSVDSCYQSSYFWKKTNRQSYFNESQSILRNLLFFKKLFFPAWQKQTVVFKCFVERVFKFIDFHEQPG